MGMLQTERNRYTDRETVKPIQRIFFLEKNKWVYVSVYIRDLRVVVISKKDGDFAKHFVAFSQNLNFNMLAHFEFHFI